MESCQAFGHRTPCAPSPPLTGLTFQRRCAAFTRMLIYLFSPESGDRKFPQPGSRRPSWMGVLKGLLWTGLSIFVGVVLALLCH